MANDNQVSVELVAKVDQLNAGLSEAKEQVTGAVEQIKGDVHSLVETAEESEGVLKTILSGEIFLIFAEVAKEALESVKEAFEGTVQRAEEFGLSNAKFASLMGVSEEKAAGLSAALTNVGASTETYEAMALRLQQTLETSTTISEQLKDKFKDSNGEFLSGTALMERLNEVTNSYAEGAERNTVLVELLGRRAKDYYDIGRATSEMVDEQTAIFERFGVQLIGAGDASRALEDAEGNLRTEWQAATIAIGQELMPVVTDLVKEFNDNAVPVFHVFVEVVHAVEEAIAALKLAFVGAGGVISGVVLELYDILKGLGTVVKDALTGNWGAIKGDVTASWDEMKTDFTSTMQVMQEQGQAFLDFTNKLYGAKAEGPEFTGTGTRVGGTRAPTRAAKKGPKDNSADEAIKDDEKLQLERVAAEESTNQHLLSMGQESVEQFIDQQRQLEDARYAIQSAALEKELALPNRTKAERQKTNDEIALLEQTHVDALLKIDQDAESRRAAISKEQLSNFLRADDERLKSGIAALQEEAAVGQITLGERDAQERALTETIRREQLARLDAEIAGLTPGTKAYEDMIKQRERVEKQFTADVKQENAQRAKDVEADVKTWLTPVTTGFKSAIKDMIAGGKSFSDSMKAIGETMLQNFLDIILQMGERWAIMQVSNAIIAKTTSSESAISQISSNAGVAASGAAASQAAIPIIGPILAAAAAASMVGLVLSYESLAHASGGMVLDRDRLVFAHNEEMILPANLSQGLQRMIAGGGGGGDFNLHYNPQITGGSKDLSALIREQPGALRAALTQMSRDGVFRPRMI